MPQVIISREEAAAQKLTHFFTGRPCRYGHTAPRFVSTGGCTECNSARAARFGKKAPALFAYPLHPSDVAVALAFCQALDLQRGRMPAGNNQVVIGNATITPVTPEEINAARVRLWGETAAKFTELKS